MDFADVEHVVAQTPDNGAAALSTEIEGQKVSRHSSPLSQWAGTGLSGLVAVCGLEAPTGERHQLRCAFRG